MLFYCLNSTNMKCFKLTIFMKNVSTYLYDLSAIHHDTRSL